MKTNYSIKNFRVFDKKGVTVEFAPLTFLVGCNSSGKSSIVKSLSLLKTFFMNKFDAQHPVIGSTIDFSVKPNDTLGSFNNVVRASSRDKSISLSFETHSKYINEDVVVTLLLTPGELGNAIVSKVSIFQKDGTLLVAASSDSHSLSGNLSSIKDAFKHYLIATRLRSQIRELLPNDPEFTVSQKDKEKVQLLEEEALRICDKEYLLEIFNDKSIQSPKFDEMINRSIDKFAETGIMTYFSVLDEMSELSTSEEIKSYLKSRVPEGKLKNALLRAIDIICDDYKCKGFSDFISYYRSYEDNYLMSSRELSSKVMLGSDNPVNIFFYFNSADRIYSLPKEATKVIPCSYLLVHDMLSHLNDNSDYSCYCEGDCGLEEYGHWIHPLYLIVFEEYVERFIFEVVSRDITEGLDYISSSRIQVRRLYPMEDRNEFSDAVRRYFDTKSKFMTLDPPITLNIMNEDGKGEHLVEVSDFVPGSFMNKWLKVFNIGDHMSLEMDSNGLGLLLKVYQKPSDKKGTLLADMGYGITQLFSILLQIEEMIMAAFYERYNGKVTTMQMRERGASISIDSFEDTPFEPRTVAIEEPEIHLHPKYQSLLAEMLYDAYSEYNIQFIIETHSEYMLRKIQTLVGANKLSAEEVSMIYVEDDEVVKTGAQKVRRIPIKDDGRLAAPFGPGFYDEADNLSLELFTNMGR